MSRLPIEVKEKAFKLRKKGYSIKEIARELNIAQSTSSIWLRDIRLTKRALNRLSKRKLVGYYKVGLCWQEKRKKREKFYNNKASLIINKIAKDKNHFRLYCSLLYWCEGTKGNKGVVKFTNSDPFMISVFMKLFRKSFKVEENKFRVLMHLHAYHDEKKQKKFWSDLTKISKTQFLKTFQKPNTGKRIKENYPGCIVIYYYDSHIVRELNALYKVFSKRMGA